MIGIVLAGLALAGVIGLAAFLYLKVLPLLHQLVLTADKHRQALGKLHSDLGAKTGKVQLEELANQMKKALEARSAKLAELEEEARVRKEEFASLQAQSRPLVEAPITILVDPPKQFAAADATRIWRALADSPPLNAKSFVAKAAAEGFTVNEVHGAVPLTSGRPLGFLIEGNTGFIWFLPNNAAPLGDLERAGFDIPASAYVASAVKALELPAEWKNGTIVSRGRVS